MKKSKGFSAKVKSRMWALYEVQGAKWTAILTDLINEQRDGKISRTARIPADARTVRSCIEERKKREDAPAVDKIYSDPWVVKARKEHLSEIRALIEKLRNFQQLVFMDHKQAFANSKGDSQPTEVEAFENEPLYASLKEHIPISAFWKDYSIWRDSWASYIFECNQFWRFISKEVNEAKKWPDVLMIDPENMYSSIEGIIRDRDMKPIKFIRGLDGIMGQRQTLWVNGYGIILTKIDPFTYKDKYREMVQRIVNNAELESVRDCYEKAVDAKNKVDISLGEIWYGRKYIGPPCRLCPGQPY